MVNEWLIFHRQMQSVRRRTPDGATIVREGHGTDEGRGSSPGEVHDIALKAAKSRPGLGQEVGRRQDLVTRDRAQGKQLTSDPFPAQIGRFWPLANPNGSPSWSIINKERSYELTRNCSRRFKAI
jgi:hypothetical protein